VAGPFIVANGLAVQWQGTRCLADRACSLCRAPVVCPELHPELHPELCPKFERTLKKRAEKGHKDRCKEDTETGTFWSQGAIPVQLWCKSGCTTRSTQRTQEVTQAAHVARQGAVPARFRCATLIQTFSVHETQWMQVRHQAGFRFTLFARAAANRSDCVLGTLRDRSKFAFFRSTLGQSRAPGMAACKT
jgi:hypothetical protein